MFERSNKLIIVGNGFDLAHGLKTSYKDLLDWYMLKAYDEFCANNHYEDSLIQISNSHSRFILSSIPQPKTYEEVIQFINSNSYYSLKYKSIFFNRIIGSLNENNWVDIEIYYFKL